MNECHIKVMAESGNRTITVRGKDEIEAKELTRIMLHMIQNTGKNPAVVTMVSQTR